MTCKLEMHNNQCKKKKEGSSVNSLALLVVTFWGENLVFLVV